MTHDRNTKEGQYFDGIARMRSASSSVVNPLQERLRQISGEKPAGRTDASVVPDAARAEERVKSVLRECCASRPAEFKAARDSDL